MIPSEYRVKWLFTDVTLYRNIVNKKIDINLLIKDIDFLFKTYLKNPANINSILIIFKVIFKTDYKNTIFLDTKIIIENSIITFNKLIRLVSIFLTIIAKLYSEIKQIGQDKFSDIVCELINTINKILVLSVKTSSDRPVTYPILDSYLVYLIPSILNVIYGQNEQIDNSIDRVISKVSTERMMIIYMGSTSKSSSDIKFRSIDRAKLDQWIQIYKDITDKEAEAEIAEIQDGLIGSCIITPAFLPTDLVFDKYIIESSLWESEKNPYTRKPLTIKYFQSYNEIPEIKEQIEIKMEIIKRLVKKYKYK